MSPDDLQQFRARLEALADELRANLAMAVPTKDSITPDNAIGRLTRMEAIQSQSMSAEGRRRQEARLRQVERALERVEKGSYGRCTQCGTEIPRGRLEVMPEAGLCMTCAARRR